MLEAVYIQYAITMREAQMFETALRAVAAQELNRLPSNTSSQDLKARTEMFFSRPIGWIQQRLDMTHALAAEISELRKVRNELAHDFLVGFMWTRDNNPEDASNPNDDFTSWLPAHLQPQAILNAVAIAKQYKTEQEAAIVQLRQWRDRFEACNSVLYERFLAPFRHFETWEEFEKTLSADHESSE